MDGRDIGERSDAVLRTAMPGHDGEVSADQLEPLVLGQHLDAKLARLGEL